MTADPRAALDAAVEAQRWSEARALARRWWHEAPGPATAAVVNARLGRAPDTTVRRRARVVVARSFTIEPLVPVLQAAARVEGVVLDVEVGGFGTWAQELLDPGSAITRDGDPAAVVLAVQARDLVPELVGSEPVQAEEAARVVDRAIGELSGAIVAFRRRSSAPLVVHSLERVDRPGLGLADRSGPRSQQAAIDAINAGLRELAAELAGVHVLDLESVVARVGRRSFFDEAKWAAMRMPVVAGALAALADEWLRYLFPLLGCSAKVLAVDLDDTLWGGVIGEDGVSGVRVAGEGPGRHHAALQRALRAVRDRGVLLAIASKNNEADALAALQSVPGMLVGADDFAARRIDWHDKAGNLRAIASELNVGLDAVAFLDDNPAERLAVSELAPEVVVLESAAPHDLADAVLTSPWFERLELSAEDVARHDYYRRERARAALAEDVATVDDYLASLATQVTIAPPSAADVARVAQLTNKTNQFNVTTRRYQDQTIADRVDDPTWRVDAVWAADRFGDHGLVGVAMTDCSDDEWRVDTLLLSCRVIGRRVETALLHELTRAAAAAGADAVTGEFIPTARNLPAATLWSDHGFDRVGEDADGVTRWRRAADAGAVEAPRHVAIVPGPTPGGREGE